MKKHRVSVLIVFTIGLSCNLAAQSAHKLLRSGDKAYKSENYNLAEENYRKALEKKALSKSHFNLGNTVYQQERFEEAVQQYEASAAKATTEAQKAEALYNKGNAQLKNGQLEEAIDAYKSALHVRPEDEEALRNLYLSKLLKQQQQQQKQQQEQQQQEQQNQNQEQEQSEQNQDEQNQQQSENSETNIDNESESSSEPEQTQELSKADAEKLLQVIENEEKNVQEKLRKASGDKKKPKKDW